MRTTVSLVGALPAAALSLASCATPARPTLVAQSVATEARIAALVARMPVERKVAQLVMPDISTITSDDVRRYRFGTILNGGNSGPFGNERAPAAKWLELADTMWDASTAPDPGSAPVVPLLWGTDAIHGHNNVVGATLFPHNIGLGATHDPALVRRIGEATAAEIAATGIDWTFAPTLAVVQDPRWGRTYESYSSDPMLVASFGAAMVEGLQGSPGSPAFLDQRHVIATAKHFFGDGGTGGIDQGDTKGDLETLIDFHGRPYPAAIGAGAQTVMASFSSINGVKMHGNRALLTGLLRDRMRFDGLVVGDWNGHAQIPGCSNTNCPQSLLAGVDVYMAPEEWRGLYDTLMRQVADGTIAMARLDEAVARVLRVKLRAGLFDKPRPSARALGGKFAELGSPAHRALAREAVRKSLVLLKNDGVLPLRSSATLLVTGPGADSIARQSGGWSISWQGGGDLTNADFPGATSIYAGIAGAMTGQGKALLSRDGAYEARPDAAIVVFGEEPYAEFSGDRKDLILRDEAGLKLIRRYQADGIPTVALFLSGRPMWMNRELAASNAFVAAWLPGSEGGGIADLVVGTATARARHDFSGRLAFAWPTTCDSNASADSFPLGWGLAYRRPMTSRPLDAACRSLDQDQADIALFDRTVAAGITTSAEDRAGRVALARLAGSAPGGGFVATPIDRNAQEDGRRLEWRAPASLIVGLPSLPKSAASYDLLIDYQVGAAPGGKLSLAADCTDCTTAIDLTSTLTVSAQKGWRTSRLPLRCLAQPSLSALRLRGGAGVTFSISALRLVPATSNADCAGPF